MQVPVGFRFNPREEELVEYYLYNKIFNGDNFKESYIQEVNLYGGGVEPWEVWDQQGGKTNDDAVYLFCRLQKASASRFCRRVGSGTWAGENAATPIKIGNGGVCGMKKRFRYEKEGSEHDGCWIMYEYAIPGHDEMVLCCLKPNKRKMKMKKRVAVVVDDNEDDFIKSKRRRTEHGDFNHNSVEIATSQPTLLAVQESPLADIDIDGDVLKDLEQNLSSHHPNATYETDLEDWLLELELDILASKQISSTSTLLEGEENSFQTGSIDQSLPIQENCLQQEGITEEDWIWLREYFSEPMDDLNLPSS